MKKISCTLIPFLLLFLCSFSYSEDKTENVIKHVPVKISPRVVTDGGYVTVSITWDTGLGEIDRFYSNIVAPDGKNFFLASDKTYPQKAKFEVPKYSVKGLWRISRITVYEKSVHERSFRIDSSILENATFFVKSNTMDRTHPVISSVQIEPKAARDGQTVTISLQVLEDLSGLAHVFGSIEAPDGKDYPISFDKKSLEDKFSIPKYATPGTWKIRYLFVKDKAGNEKRYDEDAEILKNVSFRVLASTTDSTPPTITNVKIEPEAVEDGETVTISLKAHDNLSGVKFIFGGIRAPNGKTYMIDVDVKSLKAEFKVPRKLAEGIWTVYYLKIFDKVGNEKRYSEKEGILKNATFRVLFKHEGTVIAEAEKREQAQEDINQGDVKLEGKVTRITGDTRKELDDLLIEPPSRESGTVIPHADDASVTETQEDSEPNSGKGGVEVKEKPGVIQWLKDSPPIILITLIGVLLGIPASIITIMKAKKK